MEFRLTRSPRFALSPFFKDHGSKPVPEDGTQRTLTMIRQSLPDLCRKENRTPTSALGVAFHLVDGEDLEGKPPQNYTPAIKAAMKYHRCLHQAEEPDYPESAKRRYHEQNERFEKFLADLKCRVSKSEGDEQQV